jgi:uncharacterized membrane protein (UPF0127 family)
MNRIKRSGWRGFSLGTLAASFLLLSSAWTLPARAQIGPLEELSAFPQAKLTITRGVVSHVFTIWMADTPERDAQGLMFVRELPADRGMVFADSEPHAWSMWMKNTYIPLDMLFISADGHITKIAHAIPHDETPIPSGGPVKAVIELAGGITNKLDLRVGDQVVWKPL